MVIGHLLTHKNKGFLESRKIKEGIRGKQEAKRDSVITRPEEKERMFQKYVCLSKKELAQPKC